MYPFPLIKGYPFPQSTFRGPRLISQSRPRIMASPLQHSHFLPSNLASHLVSVTIYIFRTIAHLTTLPHRVVLANFRANPLGLQITIPLFELDHYPREHR